MMNPTVSVIVPIYNVAKYLRECLDSILAQTYSDFELILVDDGSTDESGDIAEEYAQIDNRIQLFHKRNGGSSSARNYGIGKCRGGYLLFVDSDDAINAYTLEVLVKFASEYDADIVQGSGAVLKDTSDFKLKSSKDFPISEYTSVKALGEMIHGDMSASNLRIVAMNKLLILPTCSFSLDHRIY